MIPALLLLLPLALPLPAGAAGPLASRATVPLAEGAAEDVAVVGTGEGLRVIGAFGEGGLHAFGADGRSLGRLATEQSNLVEWLPPPPGDAGSAPRLAVLAVGTGEVRLLSLEGGAAKPRVRRLADRAFRLDDEATGLCAYRSPIDGTAYLFVSTDGGMVEQWALREAAGGPTGVRVRSVAVGKGAGACVVDAAARVVYVSDESVGLWHFGAEPETDPARAVAALAAPHGPLGEESKGLAIAEGAQGARWLLVADAEEPRLHALSLPGLRPTGALEVQGLGEAEGLAAGAGPGAPVVVADEAEGEDGTRLRFVDRAALDAALGAAATPAQEAAPAVVEPERAVRPDRETEPVQSFGDAADDPEIWVHPSEPSRSLVITAQKKQGIHVFDLEGRTLQVLPDGRMNNVDLRGDLVAATNRSDDTLTLYRVDPRLRRLERLERQAIPTGFIDPYGVCLYRSPRDGALYVFANDAHDARMRQWRLHEERGRVRAEAVREWRMGSLLEGCAADDALGRLYVGEEAVGLWRFDAEPDAPAEGVLVDRTEGGRLVADVEGISVYAGPEGAGYIVVSSQGSDDYVLYERAGGNRYVGRFHIVADPAAGIDGASETDGLAVSAAALGPRYPRGLLVVQDGRNLPRERQNFKYVPWERIEALFAPR